VRVSASGLAGTSPLPERLASTFFHLHDPTPALHLPPFLRTFLSEGCSKATLAHYECRTGWTMDNWGDPWADNADNAKSPTKSAVTSPLPPTFAPAPTLLNGFLDDAGWGNDDGGFGDWSTAPATVQDAEAAPTKTSMTESYTLPAFEHTSDDTPWEAQSTHDEGGWAAVEVAAPKDEEKVASDTSDTSTTIQAHDIAEDAPIDPLSSLHADDDTSTRASTSPSETSHNGVPAESPRTSYEDERGHANINIVLGEGQDKAFETRQDVPSSERPDSATSHDSEKEALSDAAPTSKAEDGDKIDTSRSADTFVVDSDLLRELFAPPKETEVLKEPPDDPIFSTSARKAWYRLTRKQTLREFNNGNDDDNYIRVTWASSQIRSEVNKTVGRWAREDRISGTGPGARASFYWDTPAPIDSKPASMHTRQQSSNAASNTITAKRESNPPLSTNAPAAFDWSSSSAPADPWHQVSPGLQSTSSPFAPMQPIVAQSQRHDGHVASLDLTLHNPTPVTGMQTLAASDETPAVTSLISPPPTSTSNTPSSEPWTGFPTYDDIVAPKKESLTAPADDEDEWGEMVSSPTLSTHTATATIPQVNTDNEHPPVPKTPPQPTRSPAVQEQSPENMHAAPIVRLRSTISPTSALFKANSFIPLGAEQGPIGPGILKSAKRVASVTATRTDKKPPARAEVELAPGPVVRPVVISRTETSDVFSAWQGSPPEVAVGKDRADEAPPKLVTPEMQEPARPSTPPQQVTAAAPSNVDAWANADFSFFESAPSAAPSSQSKGESSNSFSVFESPPRPTSSASSAKTFTRSPPRKATPPPIQPLTGATSSAQLRKTEEDQIIYEILSGLPDLSYMLKRS